MNIFYSIWLIPCKKDERFLRLIINSLAKEYHSFSFIPHLTIYGGIQAPEKIIKNIVDDILKEIKPLSIEVKKLSYSDIFSKTLFIEFRINNYIEKIYHSLRTNLKKYKDYALLPHLSLIYKNGLPDEEKKAIIKSLKIKKTMIFDCCLITSEARPIAQEKDIKDWKIISEKKFSL